jgi:hypothetical protein
MNAVRNALDTVRYNWLGASIGGPDAGMRGQWLTLVVSAVFVFGCFYALGRVRSGGSSQGGGSAALPVFSERASIPGALHGGSPAAGAVPSAIATPPPPPQPVFRRSNAESVRAAEAAQLFAAEASRTSAPSATVPVETASAPRPVPTEAKTPTRSGGGSKAAKHPSGGGSSGGGAGSGGSFDSSE